MNQLAGGDVMCLQRGEERKRTLIIIIIIRTLKRYITRTSDGERERATANTESVLDCTLITKAKRNEDLICNAIYEWTDNDIWTFIEERGMKYNPLYNKGFKRVGCIGCPLAGKEQAREFALYPKYKENYIKAFDRMLEARKKLGKDDVTGKTGLHRWTDGNVVFRWWIQDDSIDGQVELTDYLKEMEDTDERND